MVESLSSIVKSWFHDPSETFIMALGQGYLTSVLQGNFSRGCFVLSDRRVYFKGKVFEKRRSGSRDVWKSYNTQSMVNVSDITGVSFTEENDPMLRILGIITLPIGIGIFFLVAYGLCRKRFIVIQHAGGAMRVESKWYSQEEMTEFQKQISHIKDKSQKHPK